MASILDICDDVMAIIMSFIDSPEAYLAIRLVCRKFYELSEQVDGTILTKFSRERVIKNYCDDIVGRESGLLWGNRLKHGIVEFQFTYNMLLSAHEYILREKYIMGYLMSTYLIAPDRTQLIIKRIKSKSEIAQYRDSIKIYIGTFLLNCKERLDDVVYGISYNNIYLDNVSENLKFGSCMICVRYGMCDKIVSKSIKYDGICERYVYTEDGKPYTYEQYNNKKRITICYNTDGTINYKRKSLRIKNFHRSEIWEYKPNGDIKSYHYDLNGLIVFDT
jgi:hypothetical protein